MKNIDTDNKHTTALSNHLLTKLPKLQTMQLLGMHAQIHVQYEKKRLLHFSSVLKYIFESFAYESSEDINHFISELPSYFTFILRMHPLVCSTSILSVCSFLSVAE